MSFFPVKISSHTQGLLYAAATSLCWSVLAILLKNALKFTSSETIVAFRMIFAFIFLFSFSALFNMRSKKPFRALKKPPFLLVFGSLGLALNYLGFMKGVALSGASNAQIMIQLGPIVLMLTGFFFFKETLKRLQILGLTLSFVGFFLFFKDQASFPEQGNLLLANIWVVTAALSWVGYSLMMKHFGSKGYSVTELNIVVFLVCSVVLSLNLSLDELSSFSLSQWAFLALLGLNTLVAYGCFGAALQLAPASQVSIIITLNPVITLLIIAFAGGRTSFIPMEPVSAIGYMGAALVVSGVIFSSVSTKKKALKKI